MRNKLIELLKDAPKNLAVLSFETLADHLIVNGVTIREHGIWKPYRDYFTKKQTGWICSNCSVVVKGVATGDTGYCPWCGAVMDDYEDDEPPKEDKQCE